MSSAEKKMVFSINTVMASLNTGLKHEMTQFPFLCHDVIEMEMVIDNNNGQLNESVHPSMTDSDVSGPS
jgi:hypothetical protein